MSCSLRATSLRYSVLTLVAALLLPGFFLGEECSPMLPDLTDCIYYGAAGLRGCGVGFYRADIRIKLLDPGL